MKVSVKWRNRLLLIIFLLFVLLTSFGCCYSFIKINMGSPIVIDRTPITPNNEINKVNDGIKKVFTTTRDDQIIQSYEVILNGKKSSFNIVYLKSLIDKEMKITGMMNNELEIVTLKEDIDDFQNEYIDRIYGSNYMQIIMGSDGKNYLAVLSFTNIHGKMVYLLFDDEMNYINRDDEIIAMNKGQFLEVANLENVWYRDSIINKDNKSQLRVKIDGNKIYYLKHIHSGDCLGKLEDRIITIFNSKLLYDVKRSFSVINSYGTCD